MTNREISKLIQEIIDVSYFTGSRAWGVEKEDSDYDYIVSYEDYKELIEPNILRFSPKNELEVADYEIVDDLEVDDYESGEEGLCLFITHENKKYNFIVRVGNHDKQAWIKTTKFVNLIPKDLIRDREKRIQIFEAILTGYRTY
jgi:hypothetical protein